jgi:hypothetical protein
MSTSATFSSFLRILTTVVLLKEKQEKNLVVAQLKKNYRKPA